MPTKDLQITVPPDLEFSELGLAAGAGDPPLRYDRDVLQRVVEASGLPASYLADDTESQWDVIGAWYKKHLQDGGAPDPVLHPYVYPAPGDHGGFSHRLRGAA